ncbi:MAG: ABC transporter permease, partial [Gemmatimonadota bacterium]
MSEPLWRRYLRFWGPNVDRDIDDEFQFHFAMRVEQFIAEGMSRPEAVEAARRSFGNVEHVRKTLRSINVRHVRRRGMRVWWEAFSQDLRLAIRGFCSERAFALAVVATLGLGLGANAAMFGMVDRLYFQPPRLVSAPGSVARVYLAQTYPGFGTSLGEATNYPFFAEVRRSARTLAGVAGYFETSMPVGVGEAAWSAKGVLASANFFAVLGVRPALGRFFIADEESHTVADPGIVLSNEVWRTRFGADSGVLGTRLTIKGHQYPIVGVTPPRFTGVELERADLWLPLGAAGNDLFAADWYENPGDYFLRVVARVASGADWPRANAEVTTLWRRWVRSQSSFPDSTTAARAYLVPVVGERSGGLATTPETRVAAWLAGLAVIVLVIAAANVATLLGLRALRRRRETTVRRALGMSQARYAGQLVVESGLFAVLGGGVAMVVGYWIGAPIRTLMFPKIDWGDTLLDWRVFGATAIGVLAVALATGVIAAVPPERVRLAEELKSGAKALSRRRAPMQSSLLLLQTALSVLL